MPGMVRQQVVLDLLKGFSTGGLDPLKQLFWTELNYQRVNQPLSRRGWSETAADALADDPLLFAAGGEDNAFQIIYTRLKSDRLLLGLERPVISKLLQQYPHALFVVSNSTQEHWHFVNVRYDEQDSKRRLFRRITVGTDERLRTAAERLEMLDLEPLADRSPLAIQQRHDEAFDVEKVQKDFFRAFADLYDKVVADISKIREVKAEAGRLGQLLLDRMLFLYFIQKKGWLDQKPDYLYSRFLGCWQKDPRGSSYYHSVLVPLFRCLSNSAVDCEGVGDVPFLKGGLFEETAKQSPTELYRLARVDVKNSTFRTIFDDLLERFNFTVTEDTPLDVEVAIDPEMLGKIFESLILQLEKDPDKDLRKLTGSYYTPRPIVHFMCQEALKEYLVGEMAGDDGAEADAAREKIGELLSLPPADHLDDDQLARLEKLFTPAEAKSLRQSVLNCRVCDPAVGSGAFPVGMLHEMVAAAGRLDARLHGRDALGRRNYDYDLKKQIIESCLYGVDIQEQAVKLCELRLWLSLVVDYQLEPQKPFAQAIREVPSLPNLSYRIVRGDSLLERLFGHVVQLDEMAKDAKTKQLIDSIQGDKQAYFREGRTGEKRRLELKILAKQADLAERLIEAKQAAATTYQKNLFGDEHMTAKGRRDKEEREAQIHEMVDLAGKIGRAKEQLERLARQKQTVDRGDIELLRREYFHTGDAPTFMWRVDFAEVFREHQGFDTVIGNPPYVHTRTGLMDDEARESYRTMYATAVGQFDICSLFVEKSASILRRRGIWTFIHPIRLLTTQNNEAVRVFMRQQLPIRLFVDGGMPFEDASVETSIELARKGDLVTSIKTFCYDESERQVLEKAELPVELLQKLPWSSLPLKVAKEDLIAASKLSESRRRLGEEVEITRGFECGKNDEAISARELKRSLRFVTGEDVQKYRVEWSGLWAAPDWSQKSKYKTRDLFTTVPKMLVRFVSNDLTGGMDLVGYANTNVLYNVHSKTGTDHLWFVLGVFNSEPANQWFQTVFMNDDRLFPHIQKNQLEAIPLPPCGQEEERCIADLAKRITASHGASERTRLQEEIDQIVRRLFGLQPE
jgi:hypothetical protein